MTVSKDQVVSFHYTLKLADGSTLESSEGKEPVVYLHGHRGIIPGLEKELDGKDKGERFAVTVEPAEAYGEYDPALRMRLPIKHLQAHGKLRANSMAVVQTGQGPRQVMVLKVGRFHADVDANHPLAGQQLTFEGTIEDIRPASEEEIQHGHVHGPGGHSH